MQAAVVLQERPYSAGDPAGSTGSFQAVPRSVVVSVSPSPFAWVPSTTQSEALAHDTAHSRPAPVGRARVVQVDPPLVVAAAPRYPTARQCETVGHETLYKADVANCTDWNAQVAPPSSEDRIGLCPLTELSPTATQLCGDGHETPSR